MSTARRELPQAKLVSLFTYLVIGVVAYRALVTGTSPEPITSATRGVIASLMLAGRRPFDGVSPDEIMRAIVHQSVPPLTRFRRDVPPALDGLIGRMMARNILARTASMRQVGAVLEAIMRGADVPTWEVEAGGADAPRFVKPPSYISGRRSHSPPARPQPLVGQIGQPEAAEETQPSHKISVLDR